MNSENIRESFGYYLALGKEFRESINEKIEFRYGTDLFYSYQELEENSSYSNGSFVTMNDLESTTQSVGVNLIIGFNYLIGDDFVLGLEINPTVSYQEQEQNQILFNQGFTEEYNSVNDGYHFGFNQGFALVSIMYRFNR